MRGEDQVERDTTLLAAGEHISGPAAEEHRTRVARGGRFAGRVVTGPRNVQRLLTHADRNIHHAAGPDRAHTTVATRNREVPRAGQTRHVVGRPGSGGQRDPR